MSQLVRFLVTGVLCTGVDFSVYYTLLSFELEVHWAKGVGAVVGVLLNYVINSKWTFVVPPTVYTLSKFILVYMSNIAINISINSFLLGIFGVGNVGIVCAFVGATAVSCIFSFLCLKFWVFQAKRKIS